MKNIARYFLVAVIGLLSFSQVSHAENVDPMKLPRLTQYVEDFAGVLSAGDLSALRQVASEYEKKTTHQMVAVLIQNRDENELFDIGMKIFKDNQIGQKGKDNGILLVIVTDEKKIRIITGYGMEGDVPDVLARDMIEKDIRPLVNDAKYKEGIQAFYTRTMNAVGTDEGKKLQAEEDELAKLGLTFMAGIFGLLFSLNLFMMCLAAFFFIVVSLSMGSFMPIFGFIIGMIFTLFIGFGFFRSGFAKNFFEMPKGQGGWGGGWWRWGGGSSWGGGFSGGGGSSGGGWAGD